MDEFTEEEIEEIQKRIKAVCKNHDWIRLEPGVAECSICHSLIFDGEENSLELFMKYLTD